MDLIALLSHLPRVQNISTFFHAQRAESLPSGNRIASSVAAGLRSLTLHMSFDRSAEVAQIRATMSNEVWTGVLWAFCWSWRTEDIQHEDDVSHCLDVFRGRRNGRCSAPGPPRTARRCAQRMALITRSREIGEPSGRHSLRMLLTRRTHKTGQK